MSKVKLRSMKIANFSNLLKRRRTVIDSSLTTPPKTNYHVNRLAKELHPNKQYLIIDQVVVLNEYAKKYTFVPNEELGTSSLAYFEAGQYLNVDFEINGAKLSKPYSICSSPQDVKKGFYEITVKRTANGYASDYVLDNWKKGDRISVSDPSGDFVYSRLRDSKHVVGIAGGSGITPFRSLAKAISEGTEDFNLTILFGSRTKKDILFKEEFDALAENCDKINIIHVLSNEKTTEHEHGFITKELIKKYASKEAYSIFVCGPPVMYDFVDKEIKKLNLQKKYIRHELFGEPSNPEKNEDFPKDKVNKEFKLKVIVKGKETETICNSNETLLVSLEKAGIKAPSKCRSGECGFCRSRLISGTYYCSKKVDGRRLADVYYGFIHPCCTFPTSDIVIDVPVGE